MGKVELDQACKSFTCSCSVCRSGKFMRPSNKNSTLICVL